MKKYCIKYSSYCTEFADLEQQYNALNILHSRMQNFLPIGCYLILVLLLLLLFTVCFVFVTVHTRNVVPVWYESRDNLPEGECRFTETLLRGLEYEKD
jgi:hypothetical protein